VADLPLKTWIGLDGLIRMMVKLSNRDFEDNEEVLEMIKRLHIPGYEHIRLDIGRAHEAEVFDSTTPRYPDTSQIENIKRWLSE